MLFYVYLASLVAVRQPEKRKIETNQQSEVRTFYHSARVSVRARPNSRERQRDGEREKNMENNRIPVRDEASRPVGNSTSTRSQRWTCRPCTQFCVPIQHTYIHTCADTHRERLCICKRAFVCGPVSHRSRRCRRRSSNSSSSSRWV
ncbi:unnamed protein product [Trichogramma brassicae]|uniref:Uncharacterized protein n=1 Tax=Trichogramma brassicae TaxID=86971 RepID=A0A6H5J3M3_9HYME|nr:unnamed protein product [Trichogramma brassicae]